jgi:hypothetical protein
MGMPFCAAFFRKRAKTLRVISRNVTLEPDIQLHLMYL